jgi:hypothetical protein
MLALRFFYTPRLLRPAAALKPSFHQLAGQRALKTAARPASTAARPSVLVPPYYLQRTFQTRQSAHATTISSLDHTNLHQTHGRAAGFGRRDPPLRPLKVGCSRRRGNPGLTRRRTFRAQATRLTADVPASPHSLVARNRVPRPAFKSFFGL